MTFRDKRYLFGALCVICISFAGCANGFSPSSLMPGSSNVSGQWEPDVDYDAETAKRDQQEALKPKSK